MTRSAREYEAALALVEAGHNDCEISRRLGIPRQTINNWRHGLRTGRGNPSDCPICDGAFLDAPAYCYLLGLYLGDGHMVEMKRCERLSIYLDAKYPGIISEAARAIYEVLPGEMDRINLIARDGCIEVTGHWMHWTCLLPHHGPGRKHDRAIRLLNWQRDLTSGNPDMLLRGLIHSDGCRAINRVWGPGRKKRYAYPRYQFSNRSADIRKLFCEACEDFDVEWKQSNRWTISVSKREDVAKLERVIGPKK